MCWEDPGTIYVLRRVVEKSCCGRRPLPQALLGTTLLSQATAAQQANSKQTLCSLQPMQLLLDVIDAQQYLAGVDGSERIADVAKRLVSANKLAADQGGAISIVQGRLEQLDKLPADKVGVLDSSLCLPCFIQSPLLHGWG